MWCWKPVETEHRDPPAAAAAAYTTSSTGTLRMCKVEGLPEQGLLCNVRVCSENTKGRSEWRETGPFYKAHAPLPGAGGVGPRESYTWKQDADELEVTVPLPPRAASEGAGGVKPKPWTAKDLKVEIRATSIKVVCVAGGGGGGSGGDAGSAALSALLEGNLQHMVEPMGDGSFWELQKESRGGATQSLLITLAKKEEKAGTKERVNNKLWTVLIVGQ